MRGGKRWGRISCASSMSSSQIMLFLRNFETRYCCSYYAYHHIRVDSQLLLNFMYKRKALWTGSVARRLATTPKIGREAPRDDDFSIIAKKHFFNNFQHFLTFFNMFSTYFHARNNVENIFHIFNIYRRVARRHATTQRAPKIGREAPRDDPKGT